MTSMIFPIRYMLFFYFILFKNVETVNWLKHQPINELLMFSPNRKKKNLCGSSCNFNTSQTWRQMITMTSSQIYQPDVMIVLCYVISTLIFMCKSCMWTLYQTTVVCLIFTHWESLIFVICNVVIIFACWTLMRFRCGCLHFKWGFLGSTSTWERAKTIHC